MMPNELLPPGVYPIWSPYNSYEAAEILTKMLAEEKAAFPQNEQAGILKDVPETVYVFVGMFQGVVSEVQVYRTHSDATDAFKDFCGVSDEDFAAGQTELECDVEDSTIYTCFVR